MKQKYTLVALLIGASVAAGAMANDAPDQTVSAGMKAAVDKDGKLRQFTETDEEALNLNKGDTAKTLSKRLAVPQVTVVRKLNNGGSAAQIGLDQINYLVVKADESGKPEIIHRDNVHAPIKAEEK